MPVPRARWSLLLVLLALLPAAEARAATTVKPDLQLACETLSPTYGGCNSSVLAISDEPGPGGTPVRSLVKFDTAGLSLPANAIITSATLNFVTTAYEGDRYNVGEDLNARPVLAPWTSSVTYDTRNGTTPWGAGDFGAAIPSSADSFGVVFDVTKTVREIIAGTRADYGFSVGGPAVDSLEQYLAEGYGTLWEPWLEITYETGCPSDPYAAATSGDEDTVYDWNNVFLQIIRDHEDLSPLTLPAPTRTSRAAAMLNVGIFDVLNSAFFAKLEALSTGSPGAADVCGWQPYLTLAETTATVNTELAVGHAAVEILKALYPLFTSDIEAALNADYPNQGSTPTTSTAEYKLGHFVAQKVLTNRSGDGSTASMTYTSDPLTPGAYRPDDTSDSPVAPCADDSNIATPGWGNVTPFSIASGSAFRPANPGSYSTYAALLASSFYADQVNTVKDYGGETSSLRSPDQEKAAFFWANDLVGTYKPPGQLLEHTRLVALSQPAAATSGDPEAFFAHWTRQGVRVARLYAEVSIAMADAAIVAWDRKFLGAIDLWRPVSAIRLANTDYTTATTADPDWQPLSIDEDGNHFSPCFPAYSSGHATFAGAWERVFEHEFANAEHADPFPLTLTSEDPEAIERSATSRTFDSFAEAAQENADSRIWLGVHYPVDAEAGLASGRSVGAHVATNELQLTKTCAGWTCAETIP